MCGRDGREERGSRSGESISNAAEVELAFTLVSGVRLQSNQAVAPRPETQIQSCGKYLRYLFGSLQLTNGVN